ncbi:MAG TPA: ABC transporter substrate-binding protein [Candidatus Baltobacteraceae bacterium]|nr:ABC transporter substrate-binding protein [Candidatus Baltobacteraceae bacterium]
MLRRFALLAALLALAGCAAQEQNATLRIADLANPTSLNPLLAHDQETIGNDLLTVQTLTGLDEHNRVIPLLLTRIPSRQNGDVSADGKRITYRLKHGVRFADGVELTSADVAFTYRAIIDPRNPVLSQDTYKRIASIDTPDRYTAVLHLKQRWNAAVSDLFAQSDFAFGILPAHAFKSTVLANADWENHAFGTGPFRVAQWRRGDRIVLEPNPYFSPRPLLRRIELRMIPDVNTAFVALRTHDVDIAVLRTPQILAQARTTPHLRIQRTLLNDTEELDLQTQTAPTDNVKVRRAIAQALDMRGIAKAYDGIYPPGGSFIPPVMSGVFDSGIHAYPHDVRPALALMRDKAPDVVIIVQSEFDLGKRIATVVQQQLSQAGFHATIKPYPTALFNAPDGPARNGRFTISLSGWLGGADPEQSIVLTCDKVSLNGDNLARFCNKRFDADFADQAVTTDPARRRRDFIDMQHIVHDQVPQIPLYYETWYDGLNDRVGGFARNMLEFPVAPEKWSKQ